jgi:F0F1-type ATP synthase assembly protein I
MQSAARHSAQRAARLGLAAEGGKFLLSAVAFALVFAVLKPARPGLVFVGFGLLWTVQVIEGIRLLSSSAAKR